MRTTGIGVRPEASTLELVASLSNRSTRGQAACVLAARLGAEELLLFLPDPQLGVLVPAPGFTQTLRGDSAWRSFLAECSAGREAQRLVELPVGSVRTAVAMRERAIIETRPISKAPAAEADAHGQRSRYFLRVYAGAGVLALMGLALVGVALLLRASISSVDYSAGWALVVVPLTPLAIAAVMVFVARSKPIERAFDVVKKQVKADMDLIKEMSST